MERAMFVVFSEDAIVFIGQDVTEASTAFQLKNGTKIIDINGLEDLIEKFNAHISKTTSQSCDGECSDDPLSDALNSVLDRLDDMGINSENAEQYAHKFTDAGKKVVGGVKHLGCKAMKAVGEGFISIGDLMKDEADSEELKKADKED